MSGNGPPSRASAASGPLPSGAVGYQTIVGKVRLGAPGKVPFGIVGRAVSTSVIEVVPTPYGPGNAKRVLGTHVAHIGGQAELGTVRSDAAAPAVGRTRSAGTDVIRGIVVVATVERGMIDKDGEPPVGSSTRVRSARETELVPQCPPTPGTEGQGEAHVCDDGCDSQGRTRDRTREARGAQPNDPGERGRIADDDGTGTPVRDAHGAAGARRRTIVAESHVCRDPHPYHREVGRAGGGNRAAAATRSSARPTPQSVADESIAPCGRGRRSRDRLPHAVSRPSASPRAGSRGSRSGPSASCPVRSGSPQPP